MVRIETFDDAERSEEEDRVFKLRSSGIRVKEIYAGPCSFCGRWLLDEGGRAICATCRAPLGNDGIAGDLDETLARLPLHVARKLSHQRGSS